MKTLKLVHMKKKKKERKKSAKCYISNKYLNQDSNFKITKLQSRVTYKFFKYIIFPCRYCAPSNLSV